MNTIDLWDNMGNLSDEDVPLVLNRLFLIYEEQLQRNPADEASLSFFKNLDNVMTQVSECNLNRR